MPEPTASEILNFRVDAEQGGEVPVPLLKENSAIDQLNINARYHAENKWRKYNQFLDNLKNAYKDLQDISGMETYTPDKPYLQEQAGGIFGDLVDDPRKIYSPEIQGRIAKLRSEATESKLNRLYDFAHKEFLARNPELDTDTNKKRFDEFYNGKLGGRKPFTLEMPAMFDPTVLAGEIIKDKDVAIPFAESGLTKDKSMINEVTGTNFIRDQFLKKWNSGLAYEQDKYGKPVKAWAQDQFDKLSPQQKQAFGGTVESFWQKLGEEKFGAAQDVRHITKDDLQPNPNYLKDQEVQLERERNAETKRHNIATEGIDRANYNLNRDKFAETKLGTEETKNAALVFADNLFKDLLTKGSIKTANGGAVLTPTDIKGLTTDQLKYLGIELPTQRDEAGVIIQSGGLQPLVLDEDAVIEVTPNGEVMVMKNAVYDPVKRTYRGDWDNTKSTSVWNAATNRLNEENVKSGNRERNAYTAIDLRGKEGMIQVDVSGGGTKVTNEKTTAQSQSYYNEPANLVSEKDGIYIFKDNTEWKVENGKFIRIK